MALLARRKLVYGVCNIVAAECMAKSITVTVSLRGGDHMTHAAPSDSTDRTVPVRAHQNLKDAGQPTHAFPMHTI